MVSFQANSQIVAGEGRGGVVSTVATEGENTEGAPDLGLAEGGSFGFAEGAQLAGAALDDCWGDFVGKRGGFGAGTF